jgi:nitrite reductase (NADH) small subunit
MISHEIPAEVPCMNDWIDIAALSDIPQPGARVVRTDTVDIAVFRTTGNEVFALKDECPHRKGPLSQGIVHDATVTCPLHNWKIDLASGEAKAPDQGCTRTYPVKVVNGRIYLGLVSRGRRPGDDVPEPAASGDSNRLAQAL